MIVWINNPFDNLPAEGFRPQRYWLLSQAFIRAGHKVVLWTSDFSHASLAKRSLTPEALAEAERSLGHDARLILIPSRPYKTHVSFARIKSHRAYAKAWYHLGRKLVANGELTKPDVIITSVPPLSSGLVALAFRCRWNVKVVTDIQDAWPETFYRLIPAPSKVRNFLAKLIFAPIRRSARLIYTRSNAITAVAPRYLKLAADAGSKAPSHLFHLGISIPAEPAAKVPPDTGDALRLVYIGNMGRSYDLETIIRGVCETDGVELHLAGSGPDEDHLRVVASGCKRVVFHGYLRDGEMRSLLASSDVGVIPMFDESCVGIPGKLADYAAAGLPVLNSLHGETAEILARYDAGFTYNAGDVDSFKAVLQRILSRKKFLPMLSRHAGVMVRAEFDAVAIYDAFVSYVAAL